MPTQFDEGRYKVRILDQCFTTSTEKGTLGFMLAFRVLQNVDAPNVSVKPFQRDMTFWITDRTVKRVLHELHELGYAGESLSGVDPDTPSFHDFRGLEIELLCVHETTTNGTFECWSLKTRSQNVKDKSLLRKFDRMLGGNGGAANGGAAAEVRVAEDHGITDDDVPF